MYIRIHKKTSWEIRRYDSPLALANTGTEETEGLVGGGLTPPPLHVYRWWKKRGKKQNSLIKLEAFLSPWTWLIPFQLNI